MQRLLAVWFVVATTMAQACAAPSQSTNYYPAVTETPAGSATSHTATTAVAEGGSAAAATTVADTHIDTNSYTVDSGESRALTDYLNQHRLPLVGAQVLTGPSGQRAVVLHGFVGSDFGRSDASEQTRRFVGDPSIAVDNRINVRPELLSSNAPASSTGPGEASPGSSSSSTSSSANAYPGVQSYMEQQNQNQAVNQYMQQQQSTTMTTLGMIALLGIISMALASGGGSSFSGSMGTTPFGYGPYNSYPGYGSPYGGSPYGGSPFGSPSPYGSYPYGTPPPSPYNP